MGAESTGVGRRRILVVEDIYSTIQGTLDELESAGFAIEHVESVDRARIALRTIRFDLVMLDWRLPLEEGGPVYDDGGQYILSDLSQRRVGRKNEKTPIVIMTNQASGIDSAQLRRHSTRVRAVVPKLNIDLFYRVLEKEFGPLWAS